MKYSNLSKKRQNIIKNVKILGVDEQDNIVFRDSIGEIVPDAVLHNFFEFSNV